jgi:hypothetical protein
MEDALFLHQTLLKGGEWGRGGGGVGLCSYGEGSVFEKVPVKGWRLACEYFSSTKLTLLGLKKELSGK